MKNVSFPVIIGRITDVKTRTKSEMVKVHQSLSCSNGVGTLSLEQLSHTRARCCVTSLSRWSHASERRFSIVINCVYAPESGRIVMSAVVNTEHKLKWNSSAAFVKTFYTDMNCCSFILNTCVYVILNALTYLCYRLNTTIPLSQKISA